MPLTRLDNLISSKTGKYLYVSPDDFNATDSLSNRGNSPVTPFKSIQRAFLEIARYSYTPGPSNDRFDQFTVMLMPGIHYIDNRPGIVDTAGIDTFDFSQALNAWGDDPILDISNPDNVLYKFNNTEGGAIIPRGSSLVGYDLRRTTVRPLYVPEPSSVTYPRSAIFNVTGGCYFWQFTIKDGQTTAESPLYNPSIGSGEVYYDPYDFTKKAIPNFSHHKLTVFEYADKEELQLFYRKIAKAFSAYQPTIDDVSPEGIPEFDFNVQENRIVGPLSDSRVIESLKFTDATTNASIPASTTEIEVTTKVDHGYFSGQFVAISNTEIDDEIEGFWPIYNISDDPRKFTYRVPFVVSGIGQGLSSGIQVSVDTTPALGQNAQVLAEVDSVESASPYVFNVSIRSVWGICGIWANGLKATGFKSMVIAQYTGVSLQRDDRAFIRYDEYANTWNQASLVDAFATVPYHAKGDSYWKDDWRNFHVRASEDAFIQNVSIFAVGFADHFLMESGGDMSITNSNSNFGNTSLHAIGFKGFSFNQDKAGYITDIIPPQQVTENETNKEKVLYYTIDVQGSIQDSANRTKLFLGGTDLDNPLSRPAATIGGFRVGAKSNDKLYVKLDQKNNVDTFEATLEPTGFVKYIAKGSILNPSNFTIDSNNVDGANLIESNRRMIQEEIFGYILEKYPRLQNISYVNPGLDPAAGRYFDAKNLIQQNRQEIVDTAFDQMVETFGIGNIQGVSDGKCKRDIGFIVDAISEDLRDGGNRNIIEATKFYFDGNGDPINNGLVGEEAQSIFAFNRARDLCKKAIANLLTVKSAIYDPDPNSILAPYGVIAGSTGSDALGLNSAGVTVDAANLADPASRYKDARNRIVANREFILDAALAEIPVYHPDFVIPGMDPNHAGTRYADGFKSIRRNSKEIKDRALAAIAVSHPDFYFPGDPQTDDGSRFADAYRLIQQNKDEIQDRALAEIAINHPDFYFPGEAQTDAGSRFADSYRLIQQNRTEIINTAWTNMVGAYPGVASTETKCKRDIGYFVDAVSLDVFMGGNKYARKFISEYFDGNGNPISNGLVGEETESQRAFEEARDLMKQAITNQLSVQDLSITADPATGSNIDPTSCANVQAAIDTLSSIVIDVLSAGSLAGMVAETGYTSGVEELKCRRDIGYFVDAVALDLFINGNEYSYRFAAEYFDAAGIPITNGLVGETAESITAFNKARDMIKQAVTNQLYEKDLTITADNAPGSVYGQVERRFTPSFATYDPNTGTTVLTIANHGLSVGDHIIIANDSLEFTCDLDGNTVSSFYPRNTDPASLQYLEITAATTDTVTVNVGDGKTNFSNHTFVSASQEAVTFAGNTANQLIDAQTALCSDVQSAVDSLTSIVTTIISDGNLNSLPIGLNKGSGGPGETKCGRDIGYFIDAVSVDLFIGGNKHTRTFIQQYFDTNVPISNGLVGEEAESVTAFNEASNFMQQAVTNQLYDKDLTVTADPATGDNQDPASCADVRTAIATLASIATDAVTNGNLNTLPPENPGVLLAEEIKCRRDIGHIVDAVAQDLWFGGNEYTIAATKEYFDANGLITNGVDNEVGPSITAFRRAADLMNRAVNNQYYYRDLNITLDTIGDPAIVSDIHADAYNLVLDNKEFIAKEAYERMKAAYPAYTPQSGNTEQDCLDDVYNVLEEVMWDVKFGGNSKSYDSANIYITNVFEGENPVTYTPTDVSYNPATGIAVLTINNHSMVQGQYLKFADESIVFTCATNSSIQTAYPRPGDGNYGQFMQITATTINTVTVNVGISTDTSAHTFVSAAADSVIYGTTQETFIDAERDEAAKVFTEVKNIAIQCLRNESVLVSSGNTLTQKFDQTIVDDWDDDGAPLPTCGSAAAAVDTLLDIIIQAIGTDSGVGTLTATRTAPVQPSTYALGNCSDVLSTIGTLTDIICDALQAGSIADLPFISNGNWDCANVRSSIDNLFDIFTDAISSGSLDELPVINNGDFIVNAEASKCFRDVAYIVDAIANDLKYGGNINSVQAGEAYFVGTSGTVTYTPSNATYDPATGEFTMTVPGHGVQVDRYIKLADNSFTFTCGMDNNQTQKTYPRPGIDPYAGRSIRVTAVTPNTITCNVGASGPNVEFNPTDATYDPVTGVMEVTIGTHTLSVGEGVVLADNSFTFTCALDNDATQHTYPRPGQDPFAGRSIPITAVTATTITLNVGTSSDTSAHTFVSAANGAVKHLPQVAHSFVSAAADALITGGAQLEYIDGEKTETIDAWNYVGQMAIAAMRNFDFLAFNCSTNTGSAIVDVDDSSGILIGMKVEEYALSDYTNGLLNVGATPIYTNIPEGTYVKKIIDASTIELGVEGSRLETGNTVNALQTSTSTNLYFTFEKGTWADTLPETVTVGPEASDPDVIQDTTVSSSQRECASTAAAILQLTENITTIINTGLTKIVNGVEVPTIDRVEPTFNTALLASRATVFTIDTTGYGSTNAHDFETGTPVRLVPRPRFDTNTGKYVDVDKRLVRLPNGFDTNETYYVIAPGRSTQPVDYSGTQYFNGSDQTKLMLATSKENAAAGIYIYASETDVIDPDVEIDIYQFIIDQDYDLITYSCDLNNAVVGGIESDIAHIFDKPSTSTTAQKVFFRAIEGSELPDLSTTFAADPAVAITSGVDAGKINPNAEFYVRYQTSKVFTIHKTLADALNNVTPITFNNANGRFRVLANKKLSPMRFDPGFNGADTDNGKWYLQCKDRITGESDNNIIYSEIFYRIHEADYASKPTTTDTWYERVNDTRDADERTYKLRYVIPKYLENARDPINGFAIKTRTDDTRRLVPQKLLLKPVAGNVYGARFENPQQPGEFIGFTQSQFDADDTLNDLNAYDPYRRPLTGEDQDVDYRAIARFSSGVAATIQSGRYVQDSLDASIEYLELTVFDLGIDTKNFPGLRNEILTTVKISAPQGGEFVANKTQSTVGNAISFSGNSSGTAYIHSYYSVGGDHYLIIKGISGARGTASLEYSEFGGTRFTQGAVFADMLEDQDMGKSLPLKTHIRKNFPEYYYKQNGANVYTITPGDRIQDDAGIEYYVEMVEDVGVIEDTFYIFDSEELQKRIAGQQDGIYYLTALRGNISPFPQGAGVSTNFQNFKFSQPVGKLYPLNYRNDPLWFTKNGTTNEEKNYYAQLIDPPQAFSAADNYIHGKVTVNDTKNSVTRELVDDLTKQPAFVENTYTGDNEIKAQLGNATSGSEDRRIPIAGDSGVLSDQRYYVELRRPSIARAGNHTFEYLGFGPGNYSTGLPARQEIVLEPEEDFYAQSKKQDAGIVFYTGINSQGDLYIGNRRINAITGEETFIDRAVLADDGDEDDVIGQLVTTFDTPVTFNQNITIVGGPEGELVNNINSPVLINVPDRQLRNLNAPLVIYSLVSEVDPISGLPQDTSLDRESFFPNTSGDITIGKNRIDAAIFGFNSRGEGQSYKILTHAPGGVASNISPNQDALVANGGSRLANSQYVTYTNVLPTTGDILLKGSAINKNGSLGWIFANIYNTIPNTVISSLEVIVDQGVNIAKFTFIDQSSNPVTIGSLNIKSSSEIRLQNINYNGLLNGTWKVVSTPSYPYDPQDNVVYFQINPRTGTPIGAFNLNWNADIINAGVNPSPNAIVSFSVSNWKETSIIGGEALRTETETYGNFKLGINTLARATHDAYLDGFVEPLNTDPRANLDVIGNAYISGRSMTDWLAEDEYNNRERNRISDALVVGWNDEVSPNSNNIDAVRAALRVSTETSAITESGRGNNENKVGINVTDAELDRALVVRGDSRFTEDARFERDIEVNGDGTIGEIRTDITTGTFGIVDESTFTGTLNLANSVNTANIANGAETVRFADVTTNAQTINIGNNSSTNTINIGNNVTGDQFFYVGNASYHSNIYIGNTPDSATVNADGSVTTPGIGISKVSIGGAFGNTNEDLSYVRVHAQSFRVDGDQWLGFRRPGGTASLRSQASFVNFFSNSGGPSTINFGLNASEVNIAGQGGTTTINNSLHVVASTKIDGEILLCGGSAAFTILGDRAQLGSTISTHQDGVEPDGSFTKNVDILNVLVLGPTDDGYNAVDTAGSGQWGGSAYQQEVTNIGGTPEVEPQELAALSGDEYYLPIKNSPTLANGDPYLSTNDYIIVNSAVTGSGHPEFLQILEVMRANVGPYYLRVKRQPFGAFGAILTNHPDTTPIYKVNVQFDSTWLEQSVDGSGAQDNFYLAEFGGNLTTDDYIIASRNDSTGTAEYIKVAQLLNQQVQEFRINNGVDCDDRSGDVFVVNSVTGDTTITGDVTINNNLLLKGGCGTRSNIEFNASGTAGSKILTGVSIQTAEKVISDILPGDSVRVITNEAALETEVDTKVEAVDVANNRIFLDRPVLGFSAATVRFAAVRNELLTLTNGNDVPTFEVDTCTGTTHIGTQFGRIDVDFAERGGFTNTITNTAEITTAWNNDEIEFAYGFWLDPATANEGGPATTIRTTVAGSSSQIQIPVQSLGVGSGKFQVGDYVFVGDSAAATTGTGVFIIGVILQIVDTDPANPTIVIRASDDDDLQTDEPFVPSDNVFNTGNFVRRVLKHPEFSRIIDIQTRTRTVQGAQSDYCSIILDKGYIAQQKIDYLGWLCLTNSEHEAQTWTVVNGRLKGVVHQNVMDEQLKDGAVEFRTGSLHLSNNLRMIGGSLEIFDSVNKTRLFAFVNDDGHPDHQGLMTFDAGVIGRGDFYLFSAQDPENVITNPDAQDPTFSVDNLGNAEVRTTLTVIGQANATPSTSLEQLSITNLGANGNDKFAIKQDRSIDSFGLTNFYTSTGARHTRYISSASAEEDLTLIPNITYMVNTTAQSTLVLTLPLSPQTGDTVRIVDVSGNLNYNTSLVLRTAESSGTRIQGDSTGTLLGGRLTPYPSGELVVQTPNAAFALIYLGSTDSNNQVGIPSAVQGWWLTEV